MPRGWLLQVDFYKLISSRVAAALSLCEHIKAVILRHHPDSKLRVPPQEWIERVVEQWGNRAKIVSSQVYQQSAPFIYRYGRWFLMAWLAALVDGKLLVAIATSTLTYRFVAKGYEIDWRGWAATACKFLGSQLFTVSRHPIGASVIAFAGIYTLIAAWSELGGGWAAALLATGLANGMLLAKSSPARPGEPPLMTGAEDGQTYDQPWQNLTASDSLKRLIAVRTLLQRCLSRDAGKSPYLPGTAVTPRSHLVDCLRVMLIHETEPIVRVAILDGLKALQPKPQLSAGQPPLPPLKPQATSVQWQRANRQRTVEYVELG